MYTSYIGRRFLAAYRQKKGLPASYSARQFFDEVQFPLFFDGPRKAMSIVNSSFEQKVGAANELAQTMTISQYQLHRFHEGIKAGKVSGASMVGYAAEDVQKGTSGQVSNLPIAIDAEEQYASWIGQALAVGTNGGILILLDEEQVWWALFEGWPIYRRYLTETPGLKARQLGTWNGHWLGHVFGSRYAAGQPERGFSFKTKKVLGALAIPTINWLEVVLALARRFPQRILTVNAYALSQMNTTLGFVNLDLPSINRLAEHNQELSPDGRPSHFELLYQTHYTFKNACKLGQIGLRAVEPAKLRRFMPLGSRTEVKAHSEGKPYRFTPDPGPPKKRESAAEYLERQEKVRTRQQEEFFHFKIFKIWLIAMLNNRKELNQLAEQLAQTLLAFERQGVESKRGKSTDTRLVEELLGAKSLRLFIDQLTKLLGKHHAGAPVFKSIKDTTLLLPVDLFPLFLTLARFEYQYQKSL